MSPELAIEQLDSIGGGDPEGAHSMADEIILDLIEAKYPDVYEAYRGVRSRQKWWACA